MEPKNKVINVVKVLGIGDFGCRIIDYLAKEKYRNVELIAVNTDVQNLLNVQAHTRIVIGDRILHGRGTLGDPNLGRKATADSKDQIRESIKEADIVFLVAGLGGGTGTGALPPIAEIAKDVGALTIGVVSLPFSFEGDTRTEIAISRLPEIEKHIHTLAAIRGDHLVKKIDNTLSLDDAVAIFADTLFRNVVGIFRLINASGIVNLDLADIRTLLSGGSSAMMAVGQAPSEDNAESAATDALANSLGLIDIGEAKNVVFSVTGSQKMSLFEVNQIASIVKSKCSPDVNLVFGAITRPAREDLEVTILATGVRENLPSGKVGHELIPKLTDIVAENRDKAAATPKLKVFLCHSSADKPSVRKLFQRLYSMKGIDPWLDEAKLLPGVHWDSEIKKAVHESEVVIVCISKSSINKEGYVQKEIKRALDIADEKPEEMIFIIPLKLEECEVPDRLSQWQWVNYYEDDAFERLMASLQKRAESLGIEIE